MGYDLIEDVVLEILSMLPVKSLLRFSCVCKFWCALTKDPSFNTKHLVHNFGFGLDPKTNDYKVIWIRMFVHEDEDASYQPSPSLPKYKQFGVFTLSTNTWRELNINALLPDQFCDTKFYPYANGKYYWLAWHDYPVNNHLILTFDLADEVFEATPAPSLPESALDSSWRRLAFYNNSLAWIVYNADAEEICYNIWVLKDDCWTIQVTIGPLLGVGNPLGFWKDGGLLLQSRTTAELVLSNPITGEIKNLGTEPTGVFVYCESLVSIEGGTEDKGQNGSSNHAVPNFFAVGSNLDKKLIRKLLKASSKANGSSSSSSHGVRKFTSPKGLSFRSSIK